MIFVPFYRNTKYSVCIDFHERGRPVGKRKHYNFAANCSKIEVITPTINEIETKLNEKESNN